MDANGQRFHMWSERADWPDLPPELAYDGEHRVLRLASLRPPGGFAETEAGATKRLSRIPQTADVYGNRAYWDTVSLAVMGSGARPGATELFRPPIGKEPTGLATGEDGVLFIALDGGVTMVDLKLRWKPTEVRLAGFDPWRVIASAGAGAWLLSRQGAIGRFTGMPLADQAIAPEDPKEARRCEYNPDAPRIEKWADAPWQGADEKAVAIALHPSGAVTLLSWRAGGARIRTMEAGGAFGEPVELDGVHFPYSLAWLSDARIAVLVDGPAEAPVFDLAPGAKRSVVSGDLYPLRDFDPQPFVESLFAEPSYATLRGARPLRKVSLNSIAAQGSAEPAPVDSGDSGAVWHRLYVEAAIPPQCSLRILCATSDNGVVTSATPWYPHVFGESAATAPRGVWVPYPSEAAFHEGMLKCPRERDRAGLFTVLIQRAGRRVTALQGRYLHLRVELRGNGRATPEIAAIRVYGSRFSYLNRYLPELYRERVFEPEASQALEPGARTTPADFLDRFLANFEGILTPLEDRIANAHVLTHPARVPSESLEWLAAWVGMSFDPVVPEERRRAMLQSSAELAKYRGTLRGLELALDLATGGGVSGGEIVVVENYRLRRVFATILGVDLTNQADPLLPEAEQGGNSIVGDTLFLGDESRREFLALFDASLKTTASERQQIERLFDNLAHRVTVLVHQEIEPQPLGLIRRIVAAEKPAHVMAVVTPARFPLLAGIAALVGVDTYLTTRPQPGPVRVGHSRIGVFDVIRQPPSLDPRMEGALPEFRNLEAPVADIGGGPVLPEGKAIQLDGSASKPPTGRAIREYRWRRLK